MKSKSWTNQAGTWITVAMFIALGALAGVTVARGMERILPEDAGTVEIALGFGLMLLAFYAVMIVQIAVHEAGHGVFGRLTGYRFVSYRIFGLMWLRDGERVRFRRFSLAGTGGQCLMEPPGTPDSDFPVTLYNLGGSLMNLIVAAVSFALGLLLKDAPAAQVLLFEMAIVGVGFALVNGLPIKTNMVNNDGRNALDLRRDDTARRAFWIMMKINALTSRGARLRDMPAEWFVPPDAAGMGNGLTASLAVFAANRLMDEGWLEDADALMARILEHPGATPGLYRVALTCDRIYCALVGTGHGDVRALLDKAQRKTMKAMANMPSVLRTEYALALLADRDVEKAGRVEKRFEALSRSYPYPQELEAEREGMARAREIAAQSA